MHVAYAVFRCMFACITPALVIGAFAERLKFKAFTDFIVLWATLVYAPIAHWVWGLAQGDGRAGFCRGRCSAR
ncbi:MAG: hypothetical protein DRJ97_01850 [Thermoprotei archaeon]|nr:MAG: hypothetical protein DRJ97_01850 [Thermoprotei archaeon]